MTGVGWALVALALVAALVHAGNRASRDAEERRACELEELHRRVVDVARAVDEVMRSVTAAGAPEPRPGANGVYSVCAVLAAEDRGDIGRLEAVAILGGDEQSHDLALDLFREEGRRVALQHGIATGAGARAEA